MTPTPELDEALRILRKADAADMAACLVPREVRAVLDALRHTPQAAPAGAYEHPKHGLTCNLGGCSLRVESGDEGTAFYVPTPPSYAPQAATEPESSATEVAYAKAYGHGYADGFSNRAATEQQWRPIEEAPKDGTVVLLWAEGWSVTPGCWAEGRRGDGDARWRDPLVGGTYWSDPTHFQFLPVPPIHEPTNE